MKKITNEILIQELRKYGTITINENGFKYEVDAKFHRLVDAMAIEQEKTILSKFLRIAVFCFDRGFNPIFDRVLDKM